MSDQPQGTQPQSTQAQGDQPQSVQAYDSRGLSPEMRLMRWLMWLGAGVAVIALVAFAITRGVSHGPKAAPALPTQRLYGPRVTIASLHGKPALVLFWASWCKPCKREANAVRLLSDSPVGKGRIVGIDWGDPRGQALAFVRRHRWRFSNLRDPTGSVGLSYGLSHPPSLFVIDADGHIRKVLVGPQSERVMRDALLSAHR